MRKNLGLVAIVCGLFLIFGCLASTTEDDEVDFYQNEAWAYNNSHNNVTTIIQFVGIKSYNNSSCYLFETHRAKNLLAETISNDTLQSKTYYKLDDNYLSVAREEFYFKGEFNYSVDYYPYLPLVNLELRLNSSWSWNGTIKRYFASNSSYSEIDTNASFEIESEPKTLILYVEGGEFYCYVIKFMPKWNSNTYKYFWADKAEYFAKVETYKNDSLDSFDKLVDIRLNDSMRE